MKNVKLKKGDLPPVLDIEKLPKNQSLDSLKVGLKRWLLRVENCYGVKPPMTDAEKALMDAKKDHVYPKSKKDQALDAKVEFWKANKDKMLVLNGYNTKSWSRF